MIGRTRLETKEIDSTFDRVKRRLRSSVWRHFIVFVSIAFVSCVVLSSTVYPQNTSIPTNLTLEGLKGNVKRVDEETSTVVTKNGVTKETNRRRPRSMVFDERGRITYEWISIGQLPPFEHHYDHDKNGSQRRRTSREGDPNNERSIQTSLKTYRFDPSRRILFVDEYRGDKANTQMLRQIYEYHFDESGRISEHITRDSKNREVFRTTYSYDSQLIVNEQRHSMAENPVGQIFVYENTADAHGNWIRRRSQMTILKSGEKRTEAIYRRISYRR